MAKRNPLALRRRKHLAGLGLLTTLAALAVILIPTGSALSPNLSLVWDTQPADAGVNTLITGTAFDTTATKVTVKVVDANGNVKKVDGLVTLNLTAGTFTCGGSGQPACVPPSTAGFTGNTAALNDGFATFTGFMSDRTGTGFKFVASSPGIAASPASGALDIDYLTNCTGSSCSTPTVQLDNNTTGQATGQSNSFNYIAVNTNDFGGGVPAGCAGFETVGAAAIIVKDQRDTASGELVVTYGISKAQIAKKYGNTQGQQFQPICLGTRRIIEVNGKTQPVPCDQPYNGHSQSGTGWWGKGLAPSGGLFNGLLRQSVCDNNPSSPGYGYFFGIAGSFQDYTNRDPTLKIDPSWNPTVTGWSSPGTLKLFTIRFPASSGPPIPNPNPALTGDPFFGVNGAAVPWDAWGHG